ncbi:hypothetical protein [Ramlibacter rhizophilus]|uniref:Uncharacterized protein n=1 Tax=Ramlibacter rhizophilus TaxID=1781167 RepID=A0A4Z0BGX4_9BURK|nr:hypothetical protein [Ramlibacter rhizophilus]TFY98542.1 hypothetical protein EZ242_13460 [Ramlibacter rhizophilus]
MARYINAVSTKGWRDQDKCLVDGGAGRIDVRRQVDPPSRWSRLWGNSRLYVALWGSRAYRNKALEAQHRVRADFLETLKQAYGSPIAERVVRFVRKDSALTVADARAALRFAQEFSRPTQEANARLIAQYVKDHAPRNGLQGADLEHRVSELLAGEIRKHTLSEAQVLDAIRRANILAGTAPLESSPGMQRDGRPSDEQRFDSALADCAARPGELSSAATQAGLRRIIEGAQGLSLARAAEILRFAASSPPTYREHIVRDLCGGQRTVFDGRGVLRSAAFGALMPVDHSPSHLQRRMEEDIRARLATPPVDPSTGFSLHPTVLKDCNRDRFYVNGKRMTDRQEDFTVEFRAEFGEGAQADMLATIASRFMCQTNTTRMTDVLNAEVVFPLVKDYTTFHEATRRADGRWDLRTTHRSTVEAAQFPGLDGVRAIASPPSILYTISCTLTPGQDTAPPSVSDIRVEALFTSDRPAPSPR